MLIFRFTPEDYRPYALIFPRLRSYLVRNFIKSGGEGIRVKHNADVSMNIQIGKNSELGTRCMIQSNVEVGRDVIMGPDVKIYSRNHVFDSRNVAISKQGKQQLKTIVGNDVWIGANVIILPGVVIGSHSVLAAGAVITKTVPEYSVVGGNPAKVIKFRRIG